VQPDGFSGAIEANGANHPGRKEAHHIVDVNDRGFVDPEAPTFEIDNALSGGQQVAEPVDIGAVGQRDDEALPGLVSYVRSAVQPRHTSIIHLASIPEKEAKEASDQKSNWSRGARRPLGRRSTPIGSDFAGLS
jgi:hypothetical protein